MSETSKISAVISESVTLNEACTDQHLNQGAVSQDAGKIPINGKTQCAEENSKLTSNYYSEHPVYIESDSRAHETTKEHNDRDIQPSGFTDTTNETTGKTKIQNYLTEHLDRTNTITKEGDSTVESPTKRTDCDHGVENTSIGGNNVNNTIGGNGYSIEVQEDSLTPKLVAGEHIEQSARKTEGDLNNQDTDCYKLDTNSKVNSSKKCDDKSIDESALTFDNGQSSSIRVHDGDHLKESLENAESAKESFKENAGGNTRTLSKAYDTQIVNQDISANSEICETIDTPHLISNDSQSQKPIQSTIQDEQTGQVSAGDVQAGESSCQTMNNERVPVVIVLPSTQHNVSTVSTNDLNNSSTYPNNEATRNCHASQIADDRSASNYGASENGDPELGSRLDEGKVSQGQGQGGQRSTGMTRVKWFTIITMCFTNLCSSCLYSLLAPFFPPEANKKQASDIEVGLIFGTFQFVVVCFAPVYGHFITQIGSKFMMVAGIFVCSSCAVMFGFLDMCPDGTVFVVMCFVVRSVEALGAAATQTAGNAITANTFPNSVSSMMGILQAFSAIGLMVGPPLGGFLYSLGGYRLPFFVSGGVFMFATFTTFLFLPKQNDCSSSRGVFADERPKPSSLTLLKIPIIWIVGSYVFSNSAIVGFIDVSLSDHLDAFGISALYVGLIFLIPPLILVITAPLFGKINDKYGFSRPLLLFGATVATGGFLVVGPSPLLSFLPKKQLWLCIVGLTVGSLGWGANVVTFREFLDAAKVYGFQEGMETSGMVSGVYNSFSSLGALTGPLAGGFLMQYLKFPWSSTIMAGIGGFLAVILLVYTLFESCCFNTDNSRAIRGSSDEERQSLIQNKD